MAKICIICEGSYPYIVGGVSSWAHDLIRNNMENEFVIYSIIPTPDFAVLKYQPGENVSSIEKIILFPTTQGIARKPKTKKLDEDLVGLLKGIMDFTSKDAKVYISMVEKVNDRKMTPLELVTSYEFWVALTEFYKANFPQTSFNVFYWTYRNILMNIFELASQEFMEADVYHSTSTGFGGFLGALAASRGKGKLLLTEHGIYPREREEEILKAKWIDPDFKKIWIDFFYNLSRVAYEYSTDVITLFEYNRGLQIEYGADERKCTVIPNGVDLERFDKVVREEREGFNVGAVIRLVPIKDVKMMLNAIKVAHTKKMKDTMFYLIGPIDEDEEYYEECVDLVRDMDMESYVVFTGRVMVDEYFAFLDLLLLSSLSEGQPLSILEGLACSIPFVATHVGNCKEILVDKKEIGRAGIIAPPTAYSEFAEGMIRLYENRGKLKEYGANGRKIVEAYYTKENYISKYKALYEKYEGGR